MLVHQLQVCRSRKNAKQQRSCSKSKQNWCLWGSGRAPSHPHHPLPIAEEEGTEPRALPQSPTHIPCTGLGPHSPGVL